MSAPFDVSPEAEAYISECLAGEDPPGGMEPSLGLVWGGDVKDADTGVLLERFHEEHYLIGFSSPARHVNHRYFDIAGFRLAIHPHTIDSLRGKRLSIRSAVVSLGEPEKKRDFLVATPVGAEAPTT
jgi:hypothetical protein